MDHREAVHRVTSGGIEDYLFLDRLVSLTFKEPSKSERFVYKPAKIRSFLKFWTISTTECFRDTLYEENIPIDRLDDYDLYLVGRTIMHKGFVELLFTGGKEYTMTFTEEKATKAYQLRKDIMAGVKLLHSLNIK